VRALNINDRQGKFPSFLLLPSLLAVAFPKDFAVFESR
jgi:hypothetical protein